MTTTGAPKPFEVSLALSYLGIALLLKKLIEWTIFEPRMMQLFGTIAAACAPNRPQRYESKLIAAISIGNSRGKGEGIARNS